MEKLVRNEHTISLRMPSEMRSNLETLAVENKCSVASVIRFAISNLVSDE
jgi:predicted DNA-binding protein